MEILEGSDAATKSIVTSYIPLVRSGVTRVGWIGTGVMGAAMAGRIQSAGYSVTIYARNPSKTKKLHQLFTNFASSPADLARSSDVVFTMLGHPSDVRSVILDHTTGVLSALAPGGVIVDTTSSNPDLAVEIASVARSKQCYAVDAPVSGGDVGARDGKLTIFAGGDEQEVIVHHLRPLFHILGNKITYMGPPGSGQSAKIANQIAVSGSMLGLSEALVFADKSGLDVKVFLDAIKGGAAASNVMELFGNRIIQGDLAPGGFVEYIVKDLGMPVAGGSAQLSLPGAALFHTLYLGMVANGDAKLGTHALISIIGRINGMTNNLNQTAQEE